MSKEDQGIFDWPAASANPKGSSKAWSVIFKSNNPMLTLQQRKWLLLKHLLNSADTLAPVAPHQ